MQGPTTTQSPLDEIHQPTGLPVREVAQEQFRRDSVGEANADPLPGPLALAFPARSIRVGAFTVRPVTGLDIVVLRGLDSPLLRQMAEAGKPKEERKTTEFSDQAGWEMCLQFLLEPDQAESELAKGREHFARLAREKIGLAMNPVLIGLLVDAIARQFTDSFTTAVQFTQQTSGDPLNDQVFTRPPAARKTAPAGGSFTSAA